MKRKIFKLFLFLAIFSSPFSASAVNDVTSIGPTDFEILSTDTVALKTIVEANGGVTTAFDVQSNYIDITLDNGSSAQFNTDGTVFFNIEKVGGTDNYSITPACPTTSAILAGTGPGPVVLRMRVYLNPPECGGTSGPHFTFPSDYSISINNGAATTTSRNVTVHLAAVEADKYILSNDPTFFGDNWQPFPVPEHSADVPWTLTEGLGTKAVYAMFKSLIGNPSPAISDSIDLISPEEPVPLPEEPLVFPPVSEPPAEERCLLDCEKLTYDLYLVNPDGTIIYTNTKFVREEAVEPGVKIYYFDDSGADFDYNDVVVKVDKSKCDEISATVLSHDSSWHHEIKMKIYYGGILKEDVYVASASPGPASLPPRTVKMVDYQDICEAKIKYGDLLKGFLSSTVYYYARDGKRYIFPNVKTYFSWYPDFKSVKKISNNFLLEIPRGGNVNYRPGVKMVKMQTDPKVYAVDRGGTLRWVETEAAAKALYGKNWANQIEDLPEIFFLDYKIGAPIGTASDFNPVGAATGAANIATDKGIK